MTRVAVAIQALLLCMGAAIVFAAWREHAPDAKDEAPTIVKFDDEEDDDLTEPYDIPIVPYKQPVLLLDPSRDWKAEEVLVPDMPWGFPYVCFRMLKHRAVQCIYRGYDGKQTHALWVLPVGEPV